VKDFLFFAAVYGTAASIALLHVGSPVRFLFTLIDTKLFPSLWADFIPASQRGGPIRKLVHCPACLSFWIALAASILVYSPAGHHLGLPVIPRVIVDSLASVGIIFCVHVVLTKLGQYDL